MKTMVRIKPVPTCICFFLSWQFKTDALCLQVSLEFFDSELMIQANVLYTYYRASDVLQTFFVHIFILNLKCSRILMFRGNQTNKKS